MQNCKGGVNQDCIAANPTEEWKCFMAQVCHYNVHNAVILAVTNYYSTPILTSRLQYFYLMLVMILGNLLTFYSLIVLHQTAMLVKWKNLTIMEMYVDNTASSSNLCCIGIP